MTGPGYTVEPTELDTHGASLSGFAGQVQAEGERAGSITFGIDTYGIIGQAFSTQAQQVTEAAAEQIAGFAEDIRDLAACVRAGGQCYEAFDTELGRALGGNGGGGQA